MSVILYAEDEPDDVFFMERAFREAGIETPLQSLPNGESVIAYLSGTGNYADRSRYPLPALVLLDLNMPLLSGFDVLRWIRETPEISRLPVLILTSSNHAIDVQRASSLGANGYLVKPGKPNDLVELVKAFKNYWLAHDRLAAKPAAP